ncbi:cholinesterase precursor [Beauveria bassiana ARSEF 2860]|uniref:Cholinesterase n=1 Tax=Beauveria bassiana (strain ARSEF 2860) TaxID=655819 RepID=J4WBG2_BEAB2|nr:cholinesterase precursor [Beauveria bassiana ARSEF 2860]EJP67450.1 cholinesterase precursor [Beauveria bassiana ARSEF 2860]
MQFRPSWCIAAVALVAQTVQAVPSIVTLPYAKYDGLVLSNGITQWLGMRYAVPPIGNRRFRPPEEPLSETGIQEAKVHRDRCLVTGRPACDPGHSEDCLFINVQAPTQATKHSRLPVFVYLRGDGYNNTLTDANINATGLMVQNDNDFIVVTFNHRLGPYGFLTGDDGMTSNNGIRDQIKALDWVTRFIRRFGGDPEHIVLGGSGIGAQNVLIHLTMQKTYNGHFKGIIAESPPFPPLPSLEQADKQYLEFAKQMGCRSNEYPECKFSDQIGCDEKATLDCLLALSADDIQNAGHNITLSTLEAPPWDRWLPVIDHDLIIDTTTNNFRNGHFALVPFIIGNAVDTGTAFAHRDSHSTDDVIDYMSDLYPELSPEDLDEINTMYPNTNASCDTPACAYGQISNVFQDSRYVCPALIATQNMKKKEIDGSYLYLWDVDDTFDGPMDPNTRQNIEAAMLWGPVVVDVPDSFKQGRGNDAVPYVKQRYWTNFIRSLNPNRQHKFQDFKYSMTAAGKKIRLTLWPQWWAGWRKRVVFGNGGKNRKRDTGYMKWTCTFWNRLSVRMGI